MNIAAILVKFAANEELNIMEVTALISYYKLLLVTLEHYKDIVNREFRLAIQQDLVILEHTKKVMENKHDTTRIKN